MGGAGAKDKALQHDQARTAEAAGDQADAKALYEQLLQRLEKDPTSDRGALARDRLVRLGWSPPAQDQKDPSSAPNQVEAGEE